MTIWQYDEFQQVGTDYSETAEVEKYDSRHSDSRDMDAECIQALDKIEIQSQDVLIDFGSGTGTFALHAAKRCQLVHAIDVSQTMIDYAKTKAEKPG